ncbi:MAG: nucleotidyltransferase [Thaumarchaeota archaeon]|nr:MAG: nucleotidyltransferase [Nitrososphaerota archaeon]
MKAVILAGGYGKRLKPYTENVPKPLLSVAGRSILEWQIRWLKHYGFEEIVICAGYLKEKIVSEIGSGAKYGVRVGYVVEDEPLGTGGAVKNAEHVLKNDESFLLINGDILTDLDPNELLKDLEKDCLGVIALVQLPSPYGVVKFDDRNHRVLSFIEKPKLMDYWINAGVYVLRNEAFNYIPKRGDLEKTALPKLAEEGKLKAHLFNRAFWMSIDSHKDLEEASKILPTLKIFSDIS